MGTINHIAAFIHLFNGLLGGLTVWFRALFLTPGAMGSRLRICICVGVTVASTLAFHSVIVGTVRLLSHLQW